MNIQAMMKQAQQLQQTMMKEKEKIDEKVFTGKSSVVEVKVKGTKELIDVKIDIDSIEKDDVELLQDMFLVAVNDAMRQIDQETEKQLGKYTQGMPGLF